MSSPVKFSANPRTAQGSLQCRKLRHAGEVPGNLYGHKQDPVAFSANAVSVLALVKSGNRLVNIELGGKTETALLREVQWDYLGDYIQHVDLQRVDPNERLTVEVHVDLKGVAPGTLSGGILDHALHTLTVECLVTAIPDHVVVKIQDLQLGQAIHVREVELPPNVKCLNNPETIVVRVAVPQAAPEPGAEGGPAQPEVIGRKVEEKADA